MAQKTLHIDGIGAVILSKRKGQKSIRLTVRAGVARVTQPTWLPYSAGEAFLSSRLKWLEEHLRPPKQHVEGDEILGKKLHFSRSQLSALTVRITDSTINIRLSLGLYPEDDKVQTYTTKQITKLHRDKAEHYLPGRVSELAHLFGFRYKSVQVRQLKSRWGSCNSHKELVFNLNLITLDPLHIDYVILHELTHTIHMNHGPEFWSHLESVYPNAKRIAKVVRRITP